jgi:hypothetical protein
VEPEHDQRSRADEARNDLVGASPAQTADSFFGQRILYGVGLGFLRLGVSRLDGVPNGLPGLLVLICGVGCLRDGVGVFRAGGVGVG